MRYPLLGLALLAGLAATANAGPILFTVDFDAVPTGSYVGDFYWLPDPGTRNVHGIAFDGFLAQSGNGETSPPNYAEGFDWGQARSKFGFDWYYGPITFTYAAPAGLRFEMLNASGQSLGVLDLPARDFGDFATASFTYSAVGTRLVWSSEGDFGIDDLDYHVVPEPATWAMMITGFGLVGYAMRRRPVAVAA